MAQDKLRKALLEREPSMPSIHKAPTGLPAFPPSGDTGRTSPALQRYSTGLKMQNAYANNWTPNPILLRILEGK